MNYETRYEGNLVQANSLELKSRVYISDEETGDITICLVREIKDLFSESQAALERCKKKYDYEFRFNDRLVYADEVSVFSKAA